jgi:hypothetical protein
MFLFSSSEEVNVVFLSFEEELLAGFMLNMHTYTHSTVGIPSIGLHCLPLFLPSKQCICELGSLKN